MLIETTKKRLTKELIFDKCIIMNNLINPIKNLTIKNSLQIDFFKPYRKKYIKSLHSNLLWKCNENLMRIVHLLTTMRVTRKHFTVNYAINTAVELRQLSQLMY